MSKFRTPLLVLVFIASLQSAFCQIIDWQNSIGGNNTELLRSTFQTRDGGYIVGGHSASQISGDKTEDSYTPDYWILKLNYLGNIQWQNTIGGNNNDYFYSIAQTSDDGYIVAGASNTNISGDKTEMSAGLYDFWIVKLDSMGVIQWQNTIGGSNEDFPSTVIQTSDGGYMIGGSSKSNISGDKTENSLGDNDYWIIKTDSAGIIQWQNTIGGSGDDQLYSLVQANDGGYLLGGYSYSNISGDKTENSLGASDYWVVKTDAAGNIEWQNTIGGNGQEQLRCIIKTNDGGYMLGGHSASNISGDKTETSIYDDFWIIKTDSLTNIQWQNTFVASGSDIFGSIVQTDNDGFILGGYSGSDIFGDKTENSNGYNDYWIIKTDPIGNIEWQNTIGGDGHDYLSCISGTDDGGYIAGGYSESLLSGDKTEQLIGVSDYWIVKILDKYNHIEGSVFADLNTNNIQDPGELNIPYRKIKQASSGRFTFTGTDGKYSLVVTDTGNCVIEPEYSNGYFNASPLTHTVNFSTWHEIDTLNDFAFQPAGTFNDLCVTITPTTPFRSGFNAGYIVSYSNEGTTPLSPTIVFYPDANLNFLAAGIAPASVTPDSVMFAIGNILPFQNGQFFITVNVNTGLIIGSLIHSSVAILPIAGDANPSCNQNYFDVYTINAYDPNDILVNRYSLFDYEMTSPPFLEYIIRFQNTGNDTAFYVRVENKITNKLQLSTFELVNASHNCSAQYLSYDSTMRFVFNNILLPDSNVNEPASHGFVRYRMKPQVSLSVGDSITSTAGIFFDYNTPVITNTAVTQIISPTGVASTDAVEAIRVYPNPATDEITVEQQLAHKQKSVIAIYNVYGQKIQVLFEGIINAGTWTGKFDLSSLPGGVYLISINGAKTVTQRVIKL
ncbi:MAG: T9SS type A sorting domain-containing protein [Bacteroidetes bacterium]|nr:T9SS type A sorting domain-containing protein [Bacteroidota bacterium]